MKGGLSSRSLGQTHETVCLHVAKEILFVALMAMVVLFMALVGQHVLRRSCVPSKPYVSHHRKG